MKRTAEQLQQILEKEMPGFKVVEDVEADAPAAGVESDEATPDLIAAKRGQAMAGGGVDAIAAAPEEPPQDTEDQFVRVVPKHLADSPDAHQHTKVVLMSGDGKIVASQG